METLLTIKILIVGVPVFVMITAMIMLWRDLWHEHKRHKHDPKLWDDIREWRGKKPGESFSITDEELYAFIHHKKR